MPGNPCSARFRALLAVALIGAGCGGSGGGTRCGITAFAAPGLLLDEFNRPGRTLDSVPAAMPEVLPARLAVGDAFRSVVGRSDSGWIVGVEGAMPEGIAPGFGVLVVDPTMGAQGVVLFEGPPIPGAPFIGVVQVAAATIPMLALRTPVAGFQDERCPLFPDSLRR